MKVSVNFFCKKNTSAKEVKSICNFPTANMQKLGVNPHKLYVIRQNFRSERHRFGYYKVRKLSIDEILLRMNDCLDPKPRASIIERR